MSQRTTPLPFRTMGSSLSLLAGRWLSPTSLVRTFYILSIDKTLPGLLLPSTITPGSP